ncbi:MAG: hydrogenase nickel incorporation protein HypB, partial [Desulfuromonadales bacterium]|nr:hydrogenase nickel incorporation protein HypB [Desulfuromonadales bacterium]
NMISSPGSGKTTILTRTINELKDKLRIGVIEGDIQTELDAERIRATKAPAVQINTNGACHLSAAQVAGALGSLPIDNLDLVFIENVGNLVCPASFDLGEDHKVAVLSVTEGEDKPLKYPQMFQAADLMLINKIDLLPYLRFDLEQCKTFARQVNPQIKIIELSCHSGEGMQEWYYWLNHGVNQKRGTRNAERE